MNFQIKRARRLGRSFLFGKRPRSPFTSPFHGGFKSKWHGIVTKIKGAFPNQNNPLKLLYIDIQNTGKKLTMPIQNWSLSISQLAIFFEGKQIKTIAK